MGGEHDADRCAAGRAGRQLRNHWERQAGADVPGGPGFSAAYMNGDAELLSDVLHSYLIDPHGSGSSTPPANPADYSPEGHARFYEQVRQALALPEVTVVGHSFGATTALTYAALFPESTASCVAVAAFGVGPKSPGRRRGRSRGRGAAGPARQLAVV